MCQSMTFRNAPPYFIKIIHISRPVSNISGCVETAAQNLCPEWMCLWKFYLSQVRRIPLPGARGVEAAHRRSGELGGGGWNPFSFTIYKGKQLLLALARKGGGMGYWDGLSLPTALSIPNHRQADCWTHTHEPYHWTELTLVNSRT